MHFHPKKISLSFIGFVLQFNLIFGQNNSTIAHAEYLYDLNLYHDAIPLYEQLLVDSPDQAQKSRFVIRLAQCHANMKNDEKAVSLLLSMPHSTDQIIQKEHDLLLAGLYRLQKNYSKGVEILQGYCSENDCSDPIKLELGIHLWLNGSMQAAKEVLSSISFNENASAIYYTSQMYLSQIFFREKDLDAEKKLASHLATYIKEDSPYFSFLLYLKGLISFQEDNFIQSSDYFEKVLSTKGIEKQPWYELNLYYSALNDSRQLLNPILNSEQIEELFTKAEKALKLLITISPTEKHYLSLIELDTFKFKKLNDQKALSEAKALIQQMELNASLGTRTSLRLMEIDLFPDYLSRDLSYVKLLEEWGHNESVGIVWYYKGLNHFKEAAQVKDLKDSQLLYKQALLAFDAALPLLKNTNPALATTSKLYQSHARFLLDPTPANADKMMYELKDNPSGSYVEYLLRSLALLYSELGYEDQSQLLWEKIVSENTNLPFRCEALYCLANHAKKKNDLDKSKEYFKEIYMTSSTCHLASSAYFNYYSFKDYMHGQKKAIKHLEAMEKMYPQDPLLILSHYLIGLNHKKNRQNEDGKVMKHRDRLAAIEAFQKAELLFDELNDTKELSKENYSYYWKVKTQATLERAQANLEIARDAEGAKKQIYAEYAKEVFQQIQDEFHKRMLNSQYEESLEQAEFRLAELALMQGNSAKADAIFEHMLQHYEAANLAKSYLLSRLWYEKAMIKKDHQEFPKALLYLSQSEKAYDHLEPDELLDLWIQKGLCHKELGQLEEAMRVFSSVVNYETISQLRLKALYLRAEIYELQGKHDLARKQLEALAKKGGQWSLRAQEKLQ